MARRLALRSTRQALAGSPRIRSFPSNRGTSPPRAAKLSVMDIVPGLPAICPGKRAGTAREAPFPGLLPLRATRLLQFFSTSSLGQALVTQGRQFLSSRKPRIRGQEMSRKPATMVTCRSPPSMPPWPKEKRGATIPRQSPDQRRVIHFSCSYPRPREYFALRGKSKQDDVFVRRRQCLPNRIVRAGVADVLHRARQIWRRCRNTPSPVIVDHAGSVVAYVSYNGRGVAGPAWTVDTMPLYDNREA